MLVSFLLTYKYYFTLQDQDRLLSLSIHNNITKQNIASKQLLLATYLTSTVLVQYVKAFSQKRITQNRERLWASIARERGCV